MDRGTVIHQIEPVWSSDSRVLVLGTMPSPASRNAGFFYMHPQNRFWRVLPAAFGDALSFPNNADDRAAAVRERREFLLRHGIALWDVLSSCDIHGAEDSSIRNAVPNNFGPLFNGSKIHHVFCTGKTAFGLWQRLCAELYERQCGVVCRCLPSTSPANARWSETALISEYEAVRLAAEEGR